MPEPEKIKILFIINSAAGNKATDWPALIEDYFAPLNYIVELFTLPQDCNIQSIQEKINQFAAQQVVAVGGDGTVKLVAECLIQKNIPIGILPAGSANGMAKELGISEKPEEALHTLTNGLLKKIHVTTVNDQLCVHLSDIGFNAFLIKKFETQKRRGMWGYLKASLKVLLNHPRMRVEMEIDKKKVKMNAAMIVIANATKYGSGAVINPVGKLDDAMFEVIVLKKISLHEIYKMTFSHAMIDPAKTEIFQTNALKMRSVTRAHFQVDGEYLGKVNEVNASIITDALQMIVPAEVSNV